MLPLTAMDPQEELTELLERQESLRQELKAKKKELLEAQRNRKETLKRQIRRAQSRITTAERKRRTRRLILMGSYLEHVTGDDPGKRDSLMKGLDDFLERDRDRQLFDLPLKEKENGKAPPETPPPKPPPPPAPPPLPGWRPHHLATGAWGSIYLGDTSVLPSELVGARITVQSKGGESWSTTVTAVLDRSSEQVIVTNSGRPPSP